MLNEQPVLYIPYGNTKSKKKSQIPQLSNSSSFLLRSVLYGWWKHDPPAEMICKVTSCGVSFSAGREEKKHVGETSPGALLPHPAFAHSHSHSLVPFNRHGFKVELRCLTQTPVHKYRNSKVS